VISDKEEARRVSIVAYLESLGYVGVKVGSRIRFKSPLRNETTPSFYVNPERNLWYDFGLGEGGDVIDLVRRLHGLSFPEAVEHLTGGKLPRVEVSKEKKAVVPYPKTDHHRALYVAVQKTSDELFIRRYFKSQGVQYHPEIGAVTYKDTRGQRWIAIPCPNPQELKGLEHRGVNDDATDALKDGKKIRKTLGAKYPWVLVRNPKVFLITESVIDCLSGEILLNLQRASLLALNGVGNVKFLPEIVSKYQPERILLALDNDNGHQAGQLAQQKAIELIKSQGDIEVEVVHTHKVMGVKDLHQALLAQARG